MKIVIIGRNFPLGGHKDDFYHSSSKSVNGLVYCLLQIYGRAVWKLFSRFPFSSFAFLKLILYFFSVGEKFRWFFENMDHDKTEYSCSEVCELIERWVTVLQVHYFIHT